MGEPGTRDPELYHHPTTHPGARLPHAWLERDRESVSTIDLTGHQGFTVLTGIGGEPWLEAAPRVGEELGVPVTGQEVGPHATNDDILGRWAGVREIGDTGALLVRPDHHIAWRAHELADDPEAVLREALTSVLARD